MWYLKIREAEKGVSGRKELAMNAGARRINYQVGVAIKFATQENGVKVVNTRLGKSGASTFGLTKADERVPMLSVAEIYVSSFLKEDWSLTFLSFVGTSAEPRTRPNRLLGQLAIFHPDISTLQSAAEQRCLVSRCLSHPPDAMRPPTSSSQRYDASGTT